MLGERIQDQQQVLRVELGSQAAGIPIAAGAGIQSAKESLAAARVGMLLPVATYIKVQEDDEITVYQPVRFDVVWTPKLHWACYKMDLRPKAGVYSRELPIHVGAQTDCRSSVHHNAPSHDALIWCYMKAQKFEAMLQNGGIQLTRSDLFSDKDEGTLRGQNFLYRRAVYGDDARMAAAGQICMREFSRIKRHTSIGCWRLDTKEDERSWETYVGSNVGVAILTTYGKLSRHIESLFCATVEYQDESWIPEGNALYPFIYKRKAYAWEREFRIIHQLFPRTEARFRGAPFYDCSQPNHAARRTLKLDLSALIIKAFIGPNTPKATRSHLRRLTRRHGISAPMQNSAFSR